MEMKPIVCGDELEVYVPTEGCSDCDIALARIDSLMASDLGVDPDELNFDSGHQYTFNNLQDNLNALFTEINFYDDDIMILQNQINTKQDALVSGTNIKTVNNTSLLGSGNITITGSGTVVDSVIDPNSTNPVENSAIANALASKQDDLVIGNGLEISGNYLTSPLSDYYLARCSANTGTVAGVSKMIPLEHQKSSGTAFTETNGYLVCQVDGYYEVSASATWQPDSSGSTCSVHLLMDASGNSVHGYAVSVGGVYATPVISPSAYTFHAGDTIQLEITATGKNGTVAFGTAYTRVMVRRLG